MLIRISPDAFVLRIDDNGNEVRLSDDDVFSILEAGHTRDKRVRTEGDHVFVMDKHFCSSKVFRSLLEVYVKERLLRET